MTTAGKPRICFVGGDTYPILSKSARSEYMGGESVQHTLLAKGFGALGYEVSMVEQDYGQPDGEVLDDIRIWKTFARGAGIPVIRFLHPRMTSILRALARAGADVYYQSCAGALTGIVAWFCKRHGKRFIFRTASDSDCVRGKELIPNVRDRYIYYYGLKRAHLIAAQGQRQRRLLEEGHGLTGVVVNMVVEEPGPSEETLRDIDVLWVANMRPLKRPELLLDLGSRSPGRRFVMIGGALPGSEPYFRRIEERARGLSNIEFMGYVPYAEANAYFSRARLLVNTSEMEGFPNTFLQAWIRGTPTLSFFDPDDISARRQIGFIARDQDDMGALLESILTDQECWGQASATVRRFAGENYSLQAVAKRYHQLITEWVTA
jgi:glycosyltransferase involved in cell wall biosynthesis